MHWVTNPDDTLHLHKDTTWASCQHALIRVESLNKGTLSETRPSTPKSYRQQWAYKDQWEMPNPFIGYDDPYYDNHDQMLTLTLTKNGSKEDMDETKQLLESS